MATSAQRLDIVTPIPDLAPLLSALECSKLDGLRACEKSLRSLASTSPWDLILGASNPTAFRRRTLRLFQWHLAFGHNALRLAQLVDGNFAMWVYCSGCKDHDDLDGISRPPEDMFWHTFFPSNSEVCRCYVVGARSEAGIRRVGGDPEKQMPSSLPSIDQDFIGQLHPSLESGILLILADELRSDGGSAACT